LLLIARHLPQHQARNVRPMSSRSGVNQKLIVSTGALIIIDSLNSLMASEPQLLTAFLSTLVSPSTSVVTVYHDDIPLILPPSFSQYAPSPVTVVTQMATAILRVSNFFQAIEERKARDRSLAEPRWGLHEGREGVLTSIKKSISGAWTSEFVVQMELRRRSGRAVTEQFIMASNLASIPDRAAPAKIALLSDHPSFASPGQPSDMETNAEVEADSTFSLGLTEKQRLDREGVVLPYFEAQTDIGSGEGGRILYEMGREDDFDDEEDEI
jgi:elongator complex protein 5